MSENCHICGRTLTKRSRKNCQRELLLLYMTVKQKNTQHPNCSTICRSCAVNYEAWKRNRPSEPHQYREALETTSSSAATSESSASTPSVSSASSSQSFSSSAASSVAGPSRKRRHRSDLFPMVAPKLIRARIQSRHSNATKYIVLVCYDTERSSNICGYCQCKNGARTVGCCAHVATIIWYLGWARHQRDFHVPSLPMSILETHHWTDDDD